MIAYFEILFYATDSPGDIGVIVESRKKSKHYLRRPSIPKFYWTRRNTTSISSDHQLPNIIQNRYTPNRQPFRFIGMFHSFVIIRIPRFIYPFVYKFCWKWIELKSLFCSSFRMLKSWKSWNEYQRPPCESWIFYSNSKKVPNQRRRIAETVEWIFWYWSNLCGEPLVTAVEIQSRHLTQSSFLRRKNKPEKEADKTERERERER